MKKIIQLCMVLLLALPLTFAANIDSQTQSQINTMDTTHGAEMRLLQLEKAIEAQLIVGETAIVRVESETTADTNVLEELVAELEAVLLEVQQVDVEASAEVSAAEFVELKQSASAIVSAFRAEMQTIVDAQTRSEIRSEAQGEISSNARISLLASQANQARQEANKERAVTIATRAGLEATALAQVQASSAANAESALLIALANSNAQAQERATIAVSSAQTRRETIESAVDARLEGLAQRINARIASVVDVRIGSNGVVGISTESGSIRISSESRSSTSNDDDDTSGTQANAESRTSVNVSDGVSVNARVTGSFT